MVDAPTLKRVYGLVEDMIANASKEQLAECARLLAMNLAHHQSVHGEIALEETLAFVGVDTPNEAQNTLLNNAMINLVHVMHSVCGNGEGVKH